MFTVKDNGESIGMNRNLLLWAVLLAVIAALIRWN